MAEAVDSSLKLAVFRQWAYQALRLSRLQESSGVTDRRLLQRQALQRQDANTH
jgi:hypothetical protein